MKTRLGLLALVVVLAACSAQDKDTKSAVQAGDSASIAKARAVAGIARYANDMKRSIGSAPDRGELFAYRADAKVLREGAYTLRPVSLSEEHAIRAAVTGVMAVRGPDGKDIKIAYERHEENPDGNWSWIGRVIGGDQAQEAIFTFGEDAVFGSIPQANGPSLKLTTQHGIAYLMQADGSRLFRGHRAGNDVKVAAYRPNLGAIDSTGALVEMAMARARATSNADVSSKAFTSSNTIDIVAGYSNGLATRLGSDAAAVTRLSELVVAGNQALLNSKINARIRLVGAVKVNYADNTDNGAALDQLTGNDGENPVTIPAALAPLRALRETTGADLVTLVRDFQPTNNGCGIAWLLGAQGSAIVPGSDSPFGYSVVSDGNYDLSNNTYFCEDITLVHELAHNMGSAHDVANAGGVAGRYPYSYGYKTTAAAGNFFTVMAYGDDNQTLYRVFSNPNIATCGTRACGIANQADNARSLSQTISIISQFRATIVPVVGAARNDVDGDGKSDTIFHNATTRQLSYRIMNGAATTRAKTIDGVGAGYTVAATGDFNGDGRLDLIWTSSKRDLYMWTGNGTIFSSVDVGSYPSGWKVVGAGDVDGDGKSDILFHNAATRQLSYRIMNGTATKRAATVGGVGAGYTVAATGDFNGDGKLDLIWTSANLDLYLWTGNGTTFSSVKAGTYPSGWKVVGAGDVDGDGKSDIVFHNATTHQLSYRIMNGAATTRAMTISDMGAGYTVATTGDFNGDGKLDLIWTNASLDLYLWTGNGSTFTSAKAGNYPSGWSVVK